MIHRPEHRRIFGGGRCLWDLRPMHEQMTHKPARLPTKAKPGGWQFGLSTMFVVTSLVAAVSMIMHVALTSSVLLWLPLGYLWIAFVMWLILYSSRFTGMRDIIARREELREWAEWRRKDYRARKEAQDEVSDQ